MIAEDLRAVTQDEEDFFDLLTALHDSGYTGAVLLHCAGGVPKVVELPSRRIRLVTRPLTNSPKRQTLGD